MRHSYYPTLAAVAVLACALGSPAASAQSLGLWGGWSEGGHTWQDAAPPRQPANRDAYGDPATSGNLFGFGGGTGAFPALMEGGPRPAILAKPPQIVFLPNAETPGTVLIDNEARRLYFIIDTEQAYEYPISVGRDGFTWTGTEQISRIAEWPDWYPPQEMRVRDPRLPEKMYGGIRNPLGAKALFLGNSLYRIHGTNDPKTIGYAASSGCFRMMNEHVVHLASMVQVGTTVKVMERLPVRDDVASLPWQPKPAALGMPKRRPGE